MTLATVDRVRRLSRAQRRELYARLRALGPGAIASRRWKWREFWARPDQLVAPEDLRAKLVVFIGLRGEGKTRAAVEFFIAEIIAGRCKRPRIIAAKESDVWGVVIHGESGIAACLPPWVPVTYVPTSDEAPAGVVWIAGVKVACFGAHDEESTTAYAGDLDLYDDTSKWGPRGARAFKTARISCRSGRGIGIVATTSGGLRYLRRTMQKTPELRSELVCIKQAPARANANNLTAGYHARITAEQGDDALDDEEIDMGSPFAETKFDEIRAPALPRDLKRVLVSIDPATSSATHSCEVGMVGQALDVRDVVYAVKDASRVCSAEVWPGVAWDLLDELRALAPPGCRFGFLVETNKGGNQPAALLRQEEKIRKGRRGEPMTSGVEIIEVYAAKSKAGRATQIPRLIPSGQLRHLHGLEKLEAALKKLADDGAKLDNADAYVHGVVELAQLGAATPEDAAAVAAEQCALAAGMNEALRGRAPGAGPVPAADGSIAPERFAWAPPGDSRAIAPRAPAARANWRGRTMF